MPACVEIEVGKGVCGTAFKLNQTQNVPDVHQFDGHIACDSNSNSELVIPLYKNGKPIGVLDIDAPVFNRFDDTLVQFFESFAEIVVSLYEI